MELALSLSLSLSLSFLLFLVAAKEGKKGRGIARGQEGADAHICARASGRLFLQVDGSPICQKTLRCISPGDCAPRSNPVFPVADPPVLARVMRATVENYSLDSRNARSVGS